MKKVFCAATALLFLSACDMPPPKSDAIVSDSQEKQMQEAVAQVGLPDIINWQEKRLVKQIYELRDTELTTYAYVRDMSGKLHLLCKSVGYGLPYAAQYTSPEKLVRAYGGGQYIPMPQPEPNGLFMPASTNATWVMCLNPTTKKGSPVYVEDNVTVSPFELPVN